MLSFIGIGAHKSATSWIFKCLDNHSQISMYSGKEAHFFSNDEKYARGIDYYQRIFKDCDSDKVIGELSTTYLYSFETADRIKKDFPKIKIIVSLRNPVDRSISHINHLYSKNKINKNEDLYDICAKYPEIIERSMYRKYLSYYLNIFSSKQICIVLFDDIQKKPVETIQRIYNFLGVDKTYIPKNYKKKYNSSNTRSSKLFWRINKFYLRRRNSIFFKKTFHFAKLCGLDAIFVNNLFDIFKITKKDNINITQHQKQELKNIFRQDIKRLERLICIKLSKWL